MKKNFFIIFGFLLCMVVAGTMHIPSIIGIGGVGLFFLWLGGLKKTPKQRKKFYCGKVDIFRSPELRYRIEKRRR